jgi:DNA-binding NarL/FixJ family response regulator
MPAKRDTNSPAPRRTRILLVDDHPLVREGLGEALGKEPDLMICGEAEDRLQALQLIPASKPDLAIIDLALKKSNGLELIKDIRVRFPKILMLVVSMQDELLHAERAIRAGASGYITKEEATVHVVQAVRQVLRGELYVSQQLASQMAAKLSPRSLRSRPESHSALSTLTDRELEVFQLIGDGLSRQQIAERLNLDVNTVETYRSRIKEKLNLKDAQELLQFAIRSSRSGDLRG